MSRLETKVENMTPEENGEQVERVSMGRKLRVFFGLLSLALVIVVGTIGWWYVSAFNQAAGIGSNYLYNQVSIGLKQVVPQAKGRTNLLLLGLDEVSQQRSGSLLTDTIIVISIGEEGEISLLSLPRDLWIEAFKTKINALYYYGELNEDTTGEELTRTSVEDITGLEIHYSLVTKMSTVRSLIGVLGYIPIEVETGFVDNKFPRDDVPVDMEPESLRYETVEFVEGKQDFDGERALKFIRSRNSEDQEEGNDIGRSKRQQQVIAGIVTRLKSKDILYNPAIMGGIYGLWGDEVFTDLEDSDVLAIFKQLMGTRVNLKTLSIPIVNDNGSGLIFHPAIEKYDQWVYEPVDPTWKELTAWIQVNLGER